MVKKFWWAAGVAVVCAAIAGLWYWRSSGDRDNRDGAPSWSPDGARIVFATEHGTRPADIAVMEADGSARVTLVASPANDTSPAFSPDGRRIAFSSDRDGSSEIYVMDADGTNVQRLTQDPANDGAPAWSPDGARLAFMSDRDMRASADIYTMNAADGSDLQRVTRDLSNWAPQYSPDGRSLALQIDQDVALVDLASGVIRRLTRAPSDGMNPTWSPDGRQLAFVTTRNGHAEIFIMNADGTEQRSLASMPRVNLVDPRWSPRGDRIVFVALPSANRDQPGTAITQGIYTVEIATGQMRRLSP
jgi:Tol biopolymer transport system component